VDIEVFTLCDSAADYNGRLCILGVFDAIMSPTLPAIHPQVAIAIRLRLEPVEQGEHSLILHIVDDDGNLVTPALDGRFAVAPAPGEHYAKINLVLNLQGLQFNRYGHHAVKLVIDGQKNAEIPFVIRNPTPVGAPQ
jgi:hypothetical protein